MTDKTRDKAAEIARLVKLPYETRIRQDDCNGKICYMAYHPELTGCMAQGDTPEAAVKELDMAREDYIRVLVQQGIDVPLPGLVSQPTKKESFAIQVGSSVQQMQRGIQALVSKSIEAASSVSITTTFEPLDTVPSFSLGEYSIHPVGFPTKPSERKSVTAA